ncbi:MAG: ribosome recycling factor [Pseudomonadales bacterium]|nr:ribosome recycling factor [Pseudomonadales bacterium]MBO6564213.1 ribosome recycling factor [Pseudomonadales bacterium]MBO6596276.1 ribosome recycling factor [Pseudomonadales bacterium]MBO6656643.1 ribosome recycling factor [Pseudomonadales bacterium]MBO6822756.1 ribosome recycling factor [Pseudomonadales bacterium]
MIDDIKQDAEERMSKTLVSLDAAFAKIRTGRAHPSLLDGISVNYYGSDTPLNQLANITVEDGRTLVISPWEKPLIPDVEKAILKSDLGLNPSTSSDNIRLPMPPLTEENRRDLTKIAKAEAENARVAVRNIRRDANNDLKDFLKEKEITEDEARRGEDQIQQLTDAKVKDIDSALEAKEADLMEI